MYVCTLPTLIRTTSYTKSANLVDILQFALSISECRPDVDYYYIQILDCRNNNNHRDDIRKSLKVLKCQYYLVITILTSTSFDHPTRDLGSCIWSDLFVHRSKI